jgi:hypothetical protein
MIKVFLDTEFTGLHQHTTLISLGLVAETGDIFYAEFSDYDTLQLNAWLSDNVLPLLSGNLTPAGYAPAGPEVLCAGTTSEVSPVLRRWLKRLGDKNSVEIWADVLAWDWVLFCTLLGGPFNLPEQVHYIPRDLSTLLWAKGIDPDTTREELGKVTWAHPKLHLAKHHALYDAWLEKDIFEKIYRS